MPRHIIESSPSLAQYDGIVKSLASELKKDGEGPQPLILEIAAQPGPVRYVTVIWDKWKDVPEDLRPEVILAAYEKAEGKAYAHTIMTAEGVTANEALALGQLPYRVTHKATASGAIDKSSLRVVLAKEAARTVLGPKAKEMRYARKADAEAARDHLTKTWPGSVWEVVEDAEPSES